MSDGDITIKTVNPDASESAGCGSSNSEPCTESAVGTNVTVHLTHVVDVFLPLPGLGNKHTVEAEGTFRCEFQ